MAFNVAVMADGNARAAVLNLLAETGASIEDFIENPVYYRGKYSDSLLDVYQKNALWYSSFANVFLDQNPGSDVVIFVYNHQNRQRIHHTRIEETVRLRGQEVLDVVGKNADTYIIGPEKEKKRWMQRFPALKDLDSGGVPGESRVIFVTGYECGSEGGCKDSNVKNLRNIDVFLRATQMRVSGMFFPAMNDALFFCLSHTPYLYDPEHLCRAIKESFEADEEHDASNLYSRKIYEAWEKQGTGDLLLYSTFRALPPTSTKIQRTVQ